MFDPCFSAVGLMIFSFLYSQVFGAFCVEKIVWQPPVFGEEVAPQGIVVEFILNLSRSSSLMTKVVLYSQEGGMASEEEHQGNTEVGAEACSKSLDGGNASWVEEQNKINGELNRNTVLEHPRLEILPGKEVKVVYQPHKGEVYVVSRNIRKNWQLKLSISEFRHFEIQLQTIQQFYYAVERRSSIFKTVEHALKWHLGKKQEVRRYRATGLLECRIPFPTYGVAKFVSILQWRPEEKWCAAGIFRKWCIDGETGQQLIGTPSDEKFDMTAKGWDYFLEFCVNPIRNGVLMWQDNHKFCEALMKACVPSYESKFHRQEGYITQGLTRHVPSQDQELLDECVSFDSQDS
jgi:hypothetical protein